MTEAGCHAPRAPTPKEAAKELILRLGVKRVAAWAGKTEDAVYQWFRRGSDAEPVPAGVVPMILTGARAEGEIIDLNVLWPAMGEAVAAAAEDGR